MTSFKYFSLNLNYLCPCHLLCSVDLDGVSCSPDMVTSLSYILMWSECVVNICIIMNAVTQQQLVIVAVCLTIDV